MEHTSVNTPHLAMTNFISFIFFAIAYFCESLKDVTGDDVYNFMFKFLSTISVSLVIIINWSKAKPIILKQIKQAKQWKKKKKGH